MNRHLGCGCLSVALLVGLAACQRAQPPTISQDSPPFVFRSLDLHQQDAEGHPLWEISSPEARYDLRRRLAQASDLKGTIFRDGQPRYRIYASSGVVINDGEVIQLEGKIRLEQVNDPPALITASRIRWLPAKQRMELDRHPRAFDSQHSLSAQSARFQFDLERLELRGEPRLQRWAAAFNPLQSLPKQPPELQARLRELRWYPRSGRLEAAGPVAAQRLLPSGAGPQPRPGDPGPGATARSGPGGQWLTGQGLRGNTQSQTFRIGAPVILVDSALGARLTAPGLEVDWHTREAVTAPGPGGCRIERPDESLQALRCRWNWANQTVQAAGQVVLHRRAGDQTSEASLLDAQLGPSGLVVLRSPGARVISRVRVPAAPMQPPAPARPAPEPIHL